MEVTPLLSRGLATQIDVRRSSVQVGCRVQQQQQRQQLRRTTLLGNNHAEQEVGRPGRRSLLLAGVAAAVLAARPLLADDGLQPASDGGISVVAEQQGAGEHPAARGDLLLLHYVGRLKGSGAVFDSTRGGLKYRDGGQGVMRPVVLRLGGDPVPGVVAGLQAGIQGMRVGGTRTFEVPPALGFGSSQAVLAPYGVVPPGSTLVYEVELVRLSVVGPDVLLGGVANCSAGGASAAAGGCADIPAAEFL